MPHILVKIADLLNEAQGMDRAELVRDLSVPEQLKLAAALSSALPRLEKVVATLALAEFDGDGENHLHVFWSGLCGATQTLTLGWVKAGCPRGYYGPFKEAGPGIRGEIHEQIQEFRGLAGTATPRGLAHFKALVKAAS